MTSKNMNNMFIMFNKCYNILNMIIILIFKIFIMTRTESVVTLNEGLQINSRHPEFIAPVDNQTAAIGREVTFTCSIKNIGTYKVGWLRASDKMIISLGTQTVIQNDRISVKYEPLHNLENKQLSTVEYNNELMPETNEHRSETNGTWRLIIRQLKETDRGCYMCQINTNPMKSQLGCLDILVSPDIINNETSTDIAVKEGENATLTCKATGRPIPKIFWKREDGRPIQQRKIPHSTNSFSSTSTHNDSELSFYRIDRQQMGTYLCIASNDVHPAVSKRVTLAVDFIPKVQGVNQLLGAPLNTDVMIQCNVEAHPNAVNYWYKHSKHTKDMLLNGQKYVIEEERDGYKVIMRLKIKKIQVEDVGSYSCVSSNSLGIVEEVSRLYMIDKFDGQRNSEEIQHTSVLTGIAKAARGSGIRNIVDIYSTVIFFIIKFFTY